MLALIDIRRSGKSWPGSNYQSKSGQQIRFHDLSPLRLRFDQSRRPELFVTETAAAAQGSPQGPAKVPSSDHVLLPGR
jgi:hypothetical protein